MKFNKKKKNQGFTLMELLIAIAIVAILAAIAVPTYLQYVKKARYTEVLKQLETYKIAAASCRTASAQSNSDAVTKCVPGQYGIPANFVGDTDKDLVQSITVTTPSGGTYTRIVATPFAKYGIASTDTITLDVHFDIDKAVTSDAGADQTVRYDLYGVACGDKGLVSNCQTTASTGS